MENIRELRSKLCETFDRLDAGQLDIEVARELFNGGGKILSTVKCQIAYAALRGEKPEIAFLGGLDPKVLGESLVRLAAQA